MLFDDLVGYLSNYMMREIIVICLVTALDNTSLSALQMIYALGKSLLWLLAKIYEALHEISY